MLGIRLMDDAVTLTVVILARVRCMGQVTKAPAAGDLRQILCRVACTYREDATVTIDHSDQSTAVTNQRQ